jgi:hypothetical protein
MGARAFAALKGLRPRRRIKPGHDNAGAGSRIRTPPFALAEAGNPS